MRKIKSLIVCLLLLAVCLPFTACGEEKDPAQVPSNPVSTSKNVTCDITQIKTWYDAPKQEAYFEIKITFDNGTDADVNIAASGFSLQVGYDSRTLNLNCKIYPNFQTSGQEINSYKIISKTQQTMYVVGKFKTSDFHENKAFSLLVKYSGLELFKEDSRLFKFNY